MKYEVLRASYGRGVYRARGEIVEVGDGEQPPPFSVPVGVIQSAKSTDKIETLADHWDPPVIAPAGSLQVAPVSDPEPIRNDPPPMVAADRPQRRRRKEVQT